MKKRDLVKYEGRMWRIAEVHDDTVDLDDPKGSGRRKIGVSTADISLFKSMEADTPRKSVPVNNGGLSSYTPMGGGGRPRTSMRQRLVPAQSALFDDYHVYRSPEEVEATSVDDGDESLVSTSTPWGDVRDKPIISEDRFDIHSIEMWMGDDVWWRSGGRIMTGSVLGWTVAGVVVELDSALLRSGDLDTAKIPPYRLTVTEHNPPPESISGKTAAGSSVGVSKIDSLGLYYGTKVQAMVPSHRGGGGKTLDDGTITGLDINNDKVKIHIVGRGSILIPADDVMSVRDDTGGNWTASKKRTTNFAYPLAADRYSWLDDMGTHGKTAKRRAKTRDKKLRDYISAKDLINDEIKSVKAGKSSAEAGKSEAKKKDGSGVAASKFTRNTEW